MCNQIFEEFPDAEITGRWPRPVSPGVQWQRISLNCLLFMFVPNLKNMAWVTKSKDIMVKGKQVVVIEDLISTGKSSLAVIQPPGCRFANCRIGFYI
jgi:orotate phosphoribosyltransferase